MRNIHHIPIVIRTSSSAFTVAAFTFYCRCKVAVVQCVLRTASATCGRIAATRPKSLKCLALPACCFDAESFIVLCVPLCSYVFLCVHKHKCNRAVNIYNSTSPSHNVRATQKAMYGKSLGIRRNVPY